MTDGREASTGEGADGGDRLDPGADDRLDPGADDRLVPGADDRFEPDADRVRLLREVADDVRGDSSESKQVAAIVYRVSDLYDPAEETSPEEIYRNVRTILRITERGTLARDGDRD